MGRPGRITTLVGPESERLVSDVLHLTLEGEDLGAVFSRKRSLRRKQKKRAEAQDEKEIQALNTESTVSAAA